MGAGPSGSGTTEAGPSGSGTVGTGLSGLGTVGAGPSGLGSVLAAATTQTKLTAGVSPTSQPGPSTGSESSEGSISKPAASAEKDNLQKELDLNDENSEIRRRRLERFLSTASQESADKDNKD